MPRRRTWDRFFGVRNFAVLTKSRGFSGKRFGLESQFAPFRLSLDAENPNLTALLSTEMEEFYHPEVPEDGEVGFGERFEATFSGQISAPLRSFMFYETRSNVAL